LLTEEPFRDVEKHQQMIASRLHFLLLLSYVSFSLAKKHEIFKINIYSERKRKWKRNIGLEQYELGALDTSTPARLRVTSQKFFQCCIFVQRLGCSERTERGWQAFLAQKAMRCRFSSI
jgi:hypothetical protein